jgi:hypothetical protein
MSQRTPDNLKNLIIEASRFADKVIPQTPEENLQTLIGEARSLALDIQKPFAEAEIQKTLSERQRKSDKLKDPDFGLC